MSITSERGVQTFNNSLFGELRVNQAADGMIWFCLSGVCQSLGLGNASQTKSRLKPEGITTNDTPTQSGIQQMLFINEPNLYRCIFQSRKKEAELFQNWVVEEVLPSIRKLGGYMVVKENDSPEIIMARALQIANETIERSKQRVQILEGENSHLQEQNRILAPKAQYTDEVLQSTSTYTLTQIAHDLGLRSVHALTRILMEKKMLYRQSGQWQPTAKVADKGYFDTRTAKFVKSDNTIGTSMTTVITESGRQFLHSLIGKEVSL